MRARVAQLAQSGATDGQTLVWNNTLGMWVPGALTDAGSVQKSLVDAKGDLFVGSADNTVIRKAVGSDGQVVIADSTQTGGIKWGAVPSDPTKLAVTLVDAKGDLLVGNSNDSAVRLPVGADGFILMADSTVSPSGLKWVTPPSGGGGTGTGFVGRGDWTSSPTPAYSVGDMVTYLGSSYFLATAGPTGAAPTTDTAHWQLSASKGDTGAMTSRAVATYTTASLAAGASENGLITMAVGYRLLSISTSRPARVRLYGTPSDRSADASRAIGTDPTGDHGLMLEFVTSATVLSARLSPLVDGSSTEATPSSSIAMAVTNKDTVSGTVTVTLTWQRTE